MPNFILFSCSLPAWSSQYFLYILSLSEPTSGLMGGITPALRPVTLSFLTANSLYFLFSLRQEGDSIVLAIVFVPFHSHHLSIPFQFLPRCPLPMCMTTVLSPILNCCLSFIKKKKNSSHTGIFWQISQAYM